MEGEEEKAGETDVSALQFVGMREETRVKEEEIGREIWATKKRGRKEKMFFCEINQMNNALWAKEYSQRCTIMFPFCSSM